MLARSVDVAGLGRLIHDAYEFVLWEGGDFAICEPTTTRGNCD
jgi:hypothetical protein